MSRIDTLITSLAPKGVQFKSLGDIADLVRGNGMPKTDLTDSGVGAIHYGQIYTRYGAWTADTISFVTPATAAKLATVDPGDIIITNTSETVDDVGKAVAWLGERAIVTGGHATVIKHHQDPKFLSYWFQSKSFLAQKRALATGAKVIDVSAKQLAKVRVPVPPMEVQREIGRILDLFNSLEAQLVAELDARRVQYAYIRDSLVALPETGIRWVQLGDVAKVGVGQAPPKGVVSTEGTFAFVNAGTTESGRALQSNTQGGAVTIPSRGQGGVGVVGYQAEDFWCGPLCYRISSVDAGLSTRFLYYFLKSIQPSIRALQQTGGTPALNRKELVLVKVPVPPRTEQERTVGILDKFDTLVSDLKIGLPAELGARRKQYEYYRDRLLTFEDAAA